MPVATAPARSATDRPSMPRLLLPALAAMLAVYAAMMFWSLPHLSQLAGGEPMFDLRPSGYDFETAIQIVTALGEEGREFYLRTQQRLDMLFPILEFVVLLLSYLWLFPRGWAAGFSLLALAGTSFDHLENAAVAVMLKAGEALTPAMVEIASRWSILKTGFVTLSLMALIAGFLRLGWRRWRG